MKNFKLVTVFGTRPEIIRLSLLIKKFEENGVRNVLVHTGQNYDKRLSTVFFSDLKIRKPDYYLGVREQTVGSQIGKIIERSAAVFSKEKPDGVLILGDTNSGLASIAAARLDIPILHMEAGNRAYDWRVPEEKNRKIIDHISDWLFPYTEGARENLIREGINPRKIFVSGNPITEILKYFEDKIEKSAVLSRLALSPRKYFLVTLHREENVDDRSSLENITAGLRLVSAFYKKRMVVSVHPRTKKRLRGFKIKMPSSVEPYPPFSFFDFVKLEKNALSVLTDSGTVQEECSLFGVPTLTLRDSTERPETVECGSSMLTGTGSPSDILTAVRIMLNGDRSWVSPYEKDLNTAEKMVKFILQHKAKFY